MKKYTTQLREEPYRPVQDFTEAFLIIARKVEERDREERRPKGRTFESVKSGNKGGGGDVDGNRTVTVKEKAPNKKGKQMRDWGDKINKDSLESLDQSTDKGAPTNNVSATAINGLSDKNQDHGQLSELDWDFKEPGDNDSKETSKGVWRYFDNLTGQKEITKRDLKEAEMLMEDHLIQKNVAAKVAKVICASVVDNLVGKKTGTFRTISQMVREATEKAVTKILIPQNEMDLLEEIHRVRTATIPRPFIMAFVGVNGVGKSTNLSKVCFWLLQNKLRVLLVAGDTFRSGAVEQLRVHARNLSVGRDPQQLQMFERGYGKDAAAVAREAILFAKSEGIDVVMIDTAGRMQDNAPLMAALAKLVYTNQPDKLIFVGEALVGNEAIDQLEKFNDALNDNAPPSKPPVRIDGILLSKFDTIDDKVGAALTMTFVASAPILFVGVGQTYTDLRKINVRSIVSALLG